MGDPTNRVLLAHLPSPDPAYTNLLLALEGAAAQHGTLYQVDTIRTLKHSLDAGKAAIARQALMNTVQPTIQVL